FEPDRAVIASHDLRTYPRPRKRRAKVLGGNEVVDAPPDVPGAAVVHAAPPGIMSWAALEDAKRIHEPTLEQSREIGPLLVGEPGVAAVGAGVRQVDLGVGDIEVTTKDHGFAA